MPSVSMSPLKFYQPPRPAAVTPAPAASSPYVPVGIAGDDPRVPKQLPGLAGLKQTMANGGSLGMPEIVAGMPDYYSITNGNGQLGNNFRVDPAMMNIKDNKSYQALSNLAYSKGPSDIYNQQVGMVNRNLGGDLSLMREEGNRNYASGLDQLAMTGGVDAGQRERLASGNALNQMKSVQGLQRGANDQRFQAGVNDSQMKLGLMGQLGGWDNQVDQYNTGALNTAKTFNVNNAIQDKTGRNAYGLEQWGKLGDIYGSGLAADAMAKAAGQENPGLFGSGGFLGTGIGGSRGLLGTGIGSQRTMTPDAIGGGVGFMVGGPVGAGVGVGVSQGGSRLGWW